MGCERRILNSHHTEADGISMSEGQALPFASMKQVCCYIVLAKRSVLGCGAQGRRSSGPRAAMAELRRGAWSPLSLGCGLRICRVCSQQRPGEGRGATASCCAHGRNETVWCVSKGAERGAGHGQDRRHAGPVWARGDVGAGWGFTPEHKSDTEESYSCLTYP